MKYAALVVINKLKASHPQLDNGYSDNGCSVWITGTPHNVYLRRREKREREDNWINE